MTCCSDTMTTRVTLLFFAQGKFAQLLVFRTETAAHEFCRGFAFGSSVHNSTGWGVYQWPEHEQEMRERESASEVDEALRVVQRLEKDMQARGKLGPCV